MVKFSIYLNRRVFVMKRKKNISKQLVSYFVFHHPYLKEKKIVSTYSPFILKKWASKIFLPKFHANWIRFEKEKVREKSRECPNHKPRHQEEEETDKTKQAQIERAYEKH